ncbi:MAG: type VI secretion system contractile sheath small subunit [Deltaproteobacteria bacterium]|jgi:type VI secretion system protein ImpB|nr:type VI secretion system contractile sheath small subunit [Deltaproteobacteria bacterium]
MADDKSSGNKDRVNIVYKTPGDSEEKELPFKVLVMGDFTQGEDPEPFAQRQAIPVNRDNFALVFRGMAPKLRLMVPGTLSGDPDPPMIPVILALESLADFEPRNLTGKIPPLTEAYEARRKVMAAQRALSSNQRLLQGLKGLLADKGARERLRSELLLGTSSEALGDGNAPVPKAPTQGT